MDTRFNDGDLKTLQCFYMGVSGKPIELPVIFGGFITPRNKERNWKLSTALEAYGHKMLDDDIDMACYEEIFHIVFLEKDGQMMMRLCDMDIGLLDSVESKQQTLEFWLLSTLFYLYHVKTYKIYDDEVFNLLNSSNKITQKEEDEVKGDDPVEDEVKGDDPVHMYIEKIPIKSIDDPVKYIKDSFAKKRLF